MHKYDDEYDGMGGTYIVDPKTGKRKPLAEAPAPAPVEQPVKEQDDGTKK